MDEHDRRSRTRSFLIGGLVGASAAIAAARRLRPKQRRRMTPAGLAAFEDAPCFREIVELEERRAQ
jgi:surface antigen